VGERIAQPTRVIADDLTGAADAGVTLLVGGHDVTLALGAATDVWEDPARVIVAADTGTRDAEPAAASRAVVDLAARVPDGSQVLKKVDSALRGHVAVEIAALLDVWPDHLVVFAPAFPRNGRVTLGGVQHIGGIPLHHGEHWAVEGKEPPESLADLLRGHRSVSVALDVVRQPGCLALALSQAPAGEVAVCDAETDADLDRIVAAASGRTGVIWVGSAGLASALGRGMDAESADTAAGLVRRGPYLAVIGSAAGAARRQAAMLACEGPAQLIELDAAALAGGRPRTLAALAESVTTTSARHDTVVTVSGPVEPGRAAVISAALTEVVAPAATVAGALVLTGGTTARALLDALGVVALDLVAELDPGIVLARPVGRHPIPVITKSGGFGDDRTLLRAVRRISPEEGSPNHA
jgi:D-threonate/D-erythronate kinase